MRDLTITPENMNYRKINFLYVLRFLILGIFVFTCGYLHNYITELYKTELKRNLKFEEKFIEKNQLKKIELEIKYRDKEENFTDYLDYSILILLCGVAFVTFVNGKIDSENKRLDEIEKET